MRHSPEATNRLEEINLTPLLRPYDRSYSSSSASAAGKHLFHPDHAVWARVKATVDVDMRRFALLSLNGRISIGRIGFNIYMLLLSPHGGGLGYSLLQVGILARKVHGLRGRIEKWLMAKLTYDRGMIIAGILFLAGRVRVIFCWIWDGDTGKAENK